MHLRLKSQNDVVKFTTGVTVICLLGVAILQLIFLPPEIINAVQLFGVVSVFALATPISYFVGHKIREVHKLTEQLEHAANHDKLTGLCTRTSFYSKLETPDMFPCAIVVADIDFFKNINDIHGHRGGDQALVNFATTLLCNCREDDIVARFGGEEFVILLRNSTLENGLDVAKRLCDRVRSKELIFADRIVKVTASFGVALVSARDEIDNAIHRADLALYRAKRNGRDRVLAFDPALDHDPEKPAPPKSGVVQPPISRVSNG